MVPQFRTVAIEPDPQECAVVVIYDAISTVYDASGQPLRSDTQEKTKKLRVKALTERSDIGRIAEDLVDKCKLIHRNKIEMVESILYFLQRREMGDAVTADNEAEVRFLQVSVTNLGQR